MSVRPKKFAENENMTKVVHGVAHGKTIELDEDLGIAEGQSVAVRVEVLTTPAAWGDGLRRCAGALADDWTAEDDRILEQLHQDRKHETRRELPE